MLNNNKHCSVALSGTLLQWKKRANLQRGAMEEYLNLVKQFKTVTNH